MRIWVYSFYDTATGELLHKGTAQELTEAGVFCHPTRVGNVWAKYQRQLLKGIPQPWRIEREKQEVVVKIAKKPKTAGGGQPRKKKTCAKAAKVVTGKFARIKDPTPLQWDVHELCLYNEAAQRLGHPQLTYGAWVSKGRPDADALRR